MTTEAEDAIRLSEDKYCSAATMMGKSACITSRYRIEEESGEATSLER
jgi:uncharacterized OsmC-like protein